MSAFVYEFTLKFRVSRPRQRSIRLRSSLNRLFQPWKATGAQPPCFTNEAQAVPVGLRLADRRAQRGDSRRVLTPS